MDLPLWAAMTAVFACVVVVAFGIISVSVAWFGQQPAASTEAVAAQLAQRFEAIGRKVGGKGLPFFQGIQDEVNWRSSALALRCIRAGYRSHRAVLSVIGAKAVLAAIGAALGVGLSIHLQTGGVTGALIGLALASLGYLLPEWILAMLVHRRQALFLEHFPDALDLIRICLEAGLGLDAAIIRVGEEFRKICPPLQDELHTLSLELRAGASRNQCLRNFAERTGLVEVQALVTLLIQADKFGTGIADAVRVHSEQLRLNRKLRAEEAAAKVSVKLLFPLIFFIFPALLLVLLGPAAISFYENVTGSVLVK